MDKIPSTEINKQQKRFKSIDVFKGISILLMVFANTISPYENTPSWTKHAGLYGITYVDLIAPFFVFIMAFNHHLSFQHRILQSKKSSVYLHFVKRDLILISIGFIMMIGIDEVGIYLQWGILQVLGFSNLLLLITTELKLKYKPVICIFYLILHQLLLESPISELIFINIEGGIYSSFAWGSMMLLSNILSEILFETERKDLYIIISFILIFSGLVIHNFWSISRPYVSISYVTLSIGISALLYLFVKYFFEERRKNSDSLNNENAVSILGKNSLFLFLTSYGTALLIRLFFPIDTDIVIIFLMGFLNISLIWILGFLLYRAEIIIVL